MNRTTIILAMAVLFLLAGCSTASRANPEAAVQDHADASFQEALALEQKSHAKTKAERDAAESRAEVAGAAKVAADDKIAHENKQRVIEQQAADQASDHRWERGAIVVSCVLGMASLRFPAMSGLLLSLSTLTIAAAYGFAVAGWLRGHIWLVPVSGAALALLALLHHLTGKDHTNRLGPAVDAGKATLARWLPHMATIRAHWHLPPWLTGLGSLFHRASPTAQPPRTTP